MHLINTKLIRAQLDPSTLWLRSSDGRAFFPSEQGVVDLSAETFCPFSTIEVEGTPLSQQQQQSQMPHPSSSTLKATSQSTSGPSYSGFQSVVHQNRKNSGGFSLKVVQAKITHITGKGRPNFEIQGQSFIEVNEKSANVGYIRTQVQ